MKQHNLACACARARVSVCRAPVHFSQGLAIRRSEREVLFAEGSERSELKVVQLAV